MRCCRPERTRTGSSIRSLALAPRTCPTDVVAKALRALSLRHPTDDSDERDFLSKCESAVWMLKVVGSMVETDAKELDLLPRDHPTDDEKRENLRTAERGMRHAEAYLDSLRSMAASWCPNVSAYRDAIPEVERDLSRFKLVIEPAHAYDLQACTEQLSVIGTAITVFSPEVPFLVDAGTDDYVHWRALGKYYTTAEVMTHVDRALDAMTKTGDAGQYLLDHNCPLDNREAYAAQVSKWKATVQGLRDMNANILAHNR